MPPPQTAPDRGLQLAHIRALFLPSLSLNAFLLLKSCSLFFPLTQRSLECPQSLKRNSGSHLISCCCWKFMPPISQPTIPGATIPETFRRSRSCMLWIRPSALCFRRPCAITGNGEGMVLFILLCKSGVQRKWAWCEPRVSSFF